MLSLNYITADRKRLHKRAQVMNSDELTFALGNPGAVVHGNFINYYQFHPPETRIKLLPTDIWGDVQDIVCIDIGCNAGDLSISLHNYFIKIGKECKILGVDIDPILIERATEKNQNGNITFKCLDFMNIEKRNEIVNEFLNKCKVSKFDVIFCFSVTMWIHLNNGDEGLHNFLTGMCQTSKMVVIEPQPWKCYKKALKRMKSKDSFPKFKELKIRNNIIGEIEKMFLNSNFIKVKEIFEENWERTLQIYKNECINYL